MLTLSFYDASFLTQGIKKMFLLGEIVLAAERAKIGTDWLL